MDRLVNLTMFSIPLLKGFKIFIYFLRRRLSSLDNWLLVMLICSIFEHVQVVESITDLKIMFFKWALAPKRSF